MSGSPKSAWATKLAPDISTETAAAPRSVIIEVALTEVTITTKSAIRSGPGLRARPMSVSGGDQDEDSRRVDAVADLVRQTTAAEPVVIGGAGAIVADLDGGQIERIAKSPLVRAIMPNRDHGR